MIVSGSRGSVYAPVVSSQVPGLTGPKIAIESVHGLVSAGEIGNLGFSLYLCMDLSEIGDEVFLTFLVDL